jgi:hypothetical protein
VVANGGSVSASTMRAVSKFCADIDAAGIRDRFYRLNLFAGTGLNACLVPLYRGQSRTGTQYGNTTDTNANFVSGDYVETGASGGLKGLRTSLKRLETGLLVSEFDGHNFHVSAYESALSDTSFDAAVGGRNTTTSTGFNLGTSGSATTYQLGLVNNGIELASTTAGYFLAVQTGNRQGALYRNGVSETTTYAGGANTASDWSSVTWGIAVFAIQGGASSFGDYSSARLGAYSLGVSMTGTQVADLYTAMQAFQTALTRNV